MKFGIISVLIRSSSLQLGAFGEVLEGHRQKASRRFLTGGEEERGGAHDVGHVGQGAVRVGGEGQVGEDVLARLSAPILDVPAEPVVEPRQGVEIPLGEVLGPDLPRRRAQPEPFSEALVVGLGHAEKVGHHQHGEGLGIGADELAAPFPHELVEQLVG
jgi:hypothetical protein